MPTFPYYQKSTMKTAWGKRMIKIPNASDTFTYVQLASNNEEVAPPFNNFFYFAFTECTPSTTIGELQINYQYEYDPAATLMPILTVEPAEPGIMTLPVISNIFKKFKEIQRMD